MRVKPGLPLANDRHENCMWAIGEAHMPSYALAHLAATRHSTTGMFSFWLKLWSITEGRQCSKSRLYVIINYIGHSLDPSGE